MASINQIKTTLHSFASKEKAVALQRFFKTAPGDYGAGDKFLGVMVPNIRKVVKMYWQTVGLKEIEQLLHSAYHEERLLALLILVKKFEHASKLEQKKIFTLYLKNIKKYINNWDLVDLTAPRIVGAYLADKDKNILIKLAHSKNLWERRVAILATFWDIYKKDPSTALQIAEILVHDTHDLIHKAVGWMLREVGKRCSPELEEQFLKHYAGSMPRTMLRYAIERFPEKKRKIWLNYQSC